MVDTTASESDELVLVVVVEALGEPFLGVLELSELEESLELVEESDELLELSEVVVEFFLLPLVFPAFRVGALGEKDAPEGPSASLYLI